MTDRYTKAVLTVIAGALVIIAAREAVPGAKAGFGEVQMVQLCDQQLHCADVLGRPNPVIPTVMNYRLAVDAGQ